MQSTFNLAIVGSGGGAFAAAIRATMLGKSVVMIERGTFGGTCVNTGCVPSKALLAAAEARHVAADAGSRFPGIAATADLVDMPALIAGKQDLVEAMRSEKYVDVADAYGWQNHQGDAAFAGPPDAPVLEVTAADGRVETVEAAHYLIATGARPWAPPIEGLDGVDFLTSTSAMELDKVPDSLLVLGGGYVALEMAQLFARLGAKVTLLVRSRLASKEEPEVSKALQEVFADEGIRVVRRAVPTRVARDVATGQIVVTAEVLGSKQEFRADEILVALGRRPVTQGLNLDVVGVNTGDAGQVLVTGDLQSSNPRVWAAGDATGHPEFVYVAARHGTMVAENAFADAHESVDYTRMPRVTFTSPAIGSVGMTEKEVLAAGIRCDCRVLPLEYVPRAVVNRDTRGFIKMVANADTGEILGLTAVARDAGELAAAGVHILGKTITEVADAWAPYLTMAEGIRIVAKAFTTDVSMLSCCA
ncbi:mercury(II) reductase [Micrococcus luteus]|uniref:mercury(II) reductase n=1 Tax=Micrococcus TaxID=1269 RepID=UPI001072A253|nr:MULTISPECIES: mercury(II) reductase [Micrococcus]MBF0744775.1 mercury(II) reductase [Micrococcus yunnanensis]MCR4487572.1 mercury(II) reductase [Micrococcus luteus]MCV7472445.1 mercury(II) reductase [Micrococcus luteus]MCV7487627.1 mercury(II) reductase [Micrococcus luteus]MCV7600400.1 mercury(II) reductase [Micrococcus luteus]